MAEGAVTAGDPFTHWLIHFGLSKFESSLRDAGLVEYGMLGNIDDEDLAEIMADAQLKNFQKKLLRKAVNAVQDGSYPPTTPVPGAQQDEKEESKESVHPELVRMRADRKHLKGYVERLPDAQIPIDGKKTRTIIFIGQTGAGKTTLINSMCNYLHCVGYDEEFRYKLIDERKDPEISDDETKSQTRQITTYHLRKLPAIPYALNVVDTPGFGDTDGPEQDKITRGKFKQFFEAVDSIDAIYFVIKSSETKLGATQKYIFDMVLNLFGKDVKDNIFVLFTFSDGDDPPALKQVKALNVPYCTYFQINNSGFGLRAGDKKKPTHQMFFDLGLKQFAIIFEALNKIQTRTTELTRQTLAERENITTWLFQIGQDMKTALDQINEMNKTYQYLEANRSKIDANKDFLIPDTEVIVHEDPLPEPKPLLGGLFGGLLKLPQVNRYTTYCIKCVNTCHEDCAIPDGEKYRCSAMKDGSCAVCKMKCKWDLHVNKPYIIRREVKTVMRPKREMMKKYNLASNEAAKCEDIMQKLIETIDVKEAQIRTTIVKMKESVNRLSEIALNNNILTDEQYFDTLIQAEKEQGKKGWESRVQQFESMKKDNKLLRDVTQDKEPISWKENQDLMKYKEEFADKQSQENEEPQITTTESTIKVSLFGVSASHTFTTKTVEKSKK